MSGCLGARFLAEIASILGFVAVAVVVEVVVVDVLVVFLLTCFRFTVLDATVANTVGAGACLL